MLWYHVPVFYSPTISYCLLIDCVCSLLTVRGLFGDKMVRFIFLFIAGILLLTLAQNGDLGRGFVSLTSLSQHRIEDDVRDVQTDVPPQHLHKISCHWLNQLIIPCLNAILTITYLFGSSSSGGVPL